jgi:hypothetical protein
MATPTTADKINPTTNKAAIMNIFSAKLVFLNIGNVMTKLF